MRILHTSDWHLGQHFMGKSRQAEHQALIDSAFADDTRTHEESQLAVRVVPFIGRLTQGVSAMLSCRFSQQE